MKDNLNDFEKVPKATNINAHFGNTCIAYLSMGIGLTVQQLGVKAGLGVNLTYGIFGFCLLLFLVLVFTSVTTLKEFINKQQDTSENGDKSINP